MNTDQLDQLRENLRQRYDAADAWLEQATRDPHAKTEQLQVAYVKLLSRAYCEFKAKLEGAR
jgi:hypothetical protein